MTLILDGLIVAPIVGTVWCWATSPTYRTIRRQWTAGRRRHAHDRRWARAHRIRA